MSDVSKPGTRVNHNYLSRPSANQSGNGVHHGSYHNHPGNQSVTERSHFDPFADSKHDTSAPPLPQRTNYPSETISDYQHQLKNNKAFSQETNVLFVGNAGVGKSALLNVFGGSFTSGFSDVVGLTRNVTNEKVTLHGRPLRLFDVPGIDDCVEEGGDDTIVKHLLMLQETLNIGGQFVVFFVISPRNGRVEPTDYMMMKTVLDSLRQAPMVGLILTQVKNKHLAHVQSSDYIHKLLAPLVDIVDSKEFIAGVRPLVLVDHGEKGFNEEDKHRIMDYVFSFEPKPVLSRNMVDQVVRNFFNMAKRGFA
ncbi:hypothetical protein EC991_001774 [Linnemannia zychae]|nr:hypothetical protein EC991_001774 [Linnemannia zychae]